MLEKSPQMAPLLVRLHESHKLYSLAKDQDPLAQVALTNAVVDLLEVELSPREQELLTDVLITLIRQAEMDLRQALAERLAVISDVPLRLALHMANDDIIVAAPVLRKSLALSDLDLIYIIKSKGASYWQAIAARALLSSNVIDVLADTREQDTVIVLAKNERIQLTSYAIDILVEMSKADDVVAKPLLMRTGLPESLARTLYEHVGAELKEYISGYFGVEGNRAQGAVDDLILEFVEATNTEFMPSAQMMEAAEQFANQGLLNLQLMLESLQKGRIASFIALFSRYTGISAQKVHDFLKQSCPKGLAIACRAFSIQKGDFSRIYLMTHRMRAAGQVVNQKDMMEVLTYFDKVRPETAQRIVNSSLAE